MFKGKTALITGGSSGIGKEMVFLFAKEEANVVFTGSREEEKVKEIIEEAKKYNTEVLYIRADFKKRSEVDNVSVVALKKFGRIDILINNACTLNPSFVLDDSLEKIEEVFQVILYAAFQLIKALCPKMVENKWGRVINISSIAAYSSDPGIMSYATSKLAIIGMTKSLAHELGQQGVTANVILPGVTDTPLLHYGLNMVMSNTGRNKDEVLAGFMGKSKTKKVIDAKDVAELAIYLAGDSAKSITGASYNIDGGILI
jgi:3-hydroxybutyrate dehydrogenase